MLFDKRKSPRTGPLCGAISIFRETPKLTLELHRFKLDFMKNQPTNAIVINNAPYSIGSMLFHDLINSLR